MDIWVLGRDEVGVVAEDRSMTPPFRYYLTECCGASAKGLENYVGCRACYREIDPALGGIPDGHLQLVDGKWDVISDRLQLTDVYGDGLPYDEWKQRARQAALEEHVAALRGV